MQKNPLLNCPSKYKTPWDLYLENCPQIYSKTKQNGRFIPSYKAGPIDSEHKFPSIDKPLQILAPPKISPSKRAFEKYKPQGLFSEFYGIFHKLTVFKLQRSV